jgi:hypothetical protein
MRDRRYDRGGAHRASPSTREKKIERPGPALSAGLRPPMSATSPTHDVAEVTCVKTPSSAKMQGQMTCLRRTVADFKKIPRKSLMIGKNPPDAPRERSVSQTPTCLPISQHVGGRTPAKRLRERAADDAAAGNRGGVERGRLALRPATVTFARPGFASVNRSVREIRHSVCTPRFPFLSKRPRPFRSIGKRRALTAMIFDRAT